MRLAIDQQKSLAERLVKARSGTIGDELVNAIVGAEQVDEAGIHEQRLRDLGFAQVRLRHHGEVARIEIEPSELPKALDPAMARAIAQAIKPLGFQFVSLDLETTGLNASTDR